MMKELTVTMGRTVNLGNYESARVEVGVVVECDYATDGDRRTSAVVADDTFELARGFVARMLAREVVAVTEGAARKEGVMAALMDVADDG